MIAKTTTALAALALVAAALPAAANTTDCLPMDEARAKGLFDKWAAALPGHNEDLMLAFYAPDATVKPHDATAPLGDRAAQRAWWKEFVDETPKATLSEARTEIACNSFTKTGTKMIDVGGQSVKAQFTMAFENRDGTWLITRHEITPTAN